MSPNRNLLDGQYVDVVLRAPTFIADSAGLYMCPRGAQSLSSCEYRGTAEQQVDLTYRGRISVRRTFQSDGSLFVCQRPADCTVAADVLTEIVGASVSILANGPTPSITVSPDSELLDQQLVDVSMTGFPPNVELNVAQCRPAPGNPFASCGNWQGSFSSGTGEPIFNTFRVQRTFYASSSPEGEVTCDAPGVCTLYVGPELTLGSTGVWGATYPLDFAFVGAPRAGVVSVPSSPLRAGDAAPVTGSGWAETANLVLRICGARSPDFDLCGASFTVQLPPGETGFSTSLWVPGDVTGWVGDRFRMVDCTAAPGACWVVVHDTRDPLGTLAAAPLTVEPLPRQRGTATLDLRTPLVDGLVARVIGSGWDPNTGFAFFICEGEGFDFCWPSNELFSRGRAGDLRSYVPVFGTARAGAEVMDCTSAPERCSLVVADRQTLSSAVRIPLTFYAGNAIDVPSSYEPKYHTLLERGVEVSGLPPEELQRRGPLTALWLLALARVSTGVHLPLAGSLTYTTQYTPDEYRGVSLHAALFDYTLEELQKTGTVFWSWILAGRPEPRPAP